MLHKSDNQLIFEMYMGKQNITQFWLLLNKLGFKGKIQDNKFLMRLPSPDDADEEVANFKLFAQIFKNNNITGEIVNQLNKILEEIETFHPTNTEDYIDLVIDMTATFDYQSAFQAIADHFGFSDVRINAETSGDYQVLTMV